MIAPKMLIVTYLDNLEEGKLHKAIITCRTEGRVSVMFVCLGNICRSPMAGAVFKHVVDQRGLSDHFHRIESCGTGDYHIGEEPDERTVETCRKHGVPINSLAQQIAPEHFQQFDYILGMDHQNVANLERMRPKAKSSAQVKLFGSFGDGRVIQDPYYGGHDGYPSPSRPTPQIADLVHVESFTQTYRQVVSYSEGLLESILTDRVEWKAKS